MAFCRFVPRICKGMGPCSPQSAALYVARAVNELQGNSLRRQLPTSQELLAVLGPDRLALVEERLELGDRQMCLIEPQDVDAVMDMYIKRGQGDRDPYWSRPWPAATALAREILRQPDLVRGRRVCEVGAGLGIASIAAAMAGAAEVVLTDREPLALHCALMSARASGVADEADTMAALRLLEGQALQHAPRVRGEVLDWTQPYRGPEYDVVLACDVLYEDFSVEPVGRFVGQLLSSGGRLLMADPSERTRHNREYLVDMLLGDADAPMLLEECTTVLERMDDKAHPVEIMQFRFRQAGETVGLKGLRR